MESFTPESIVVRLIADKPVRKTPYQVKGVFMKQFSDEKIVPFLDGRLRNKYLYPRVQVKILNEQIYIIGLKEGVNPVLSLVDNVKSFNFGDITIGIEKYDVEENNDQFIHTEKLLRYKVIIPWIALNKSTGGKYRFLTDQEKPLFLNKLLGLNLLFLSKELGLDTKLFPDKETKSDHGELLRTIGFSSAPGLIRVFGFTPELMTVTFIGSSFWMLACMVVGVRQALDYKSLWKAFGVVVVCWFIQAFLLLLIVMLFSK